MNVELLELAVAALGDLVDDVVFVGGATIGLWVTDPAAPPERPTKTSEVTYDSNGAILRLEDAEVDAAVSVQTTTAGRVATITAGDDTTQTVTSYSYNDGRLVGVSGDDLENQSLSWVDGRLAEMVSAGAGTLALEYDPTGRVMRLETRAANGAPERMLTFSYSAGATTVDDGLDSVVYRFDDSSRQVVVPDAGNPDVHVDGAVDTDDHGDVVYVGAGTEHHVSTVVTDDRSGVAYVRLRNAQGLTLDERVFSCTPAVTGGSTLEQERCPRQVQADLDFSLGTQTTGTLGLSIEAGDPAGNTVVAPFEAAIDRVPPVGPSGFGFTAFDSASGSATLEWSELDDAPLSTSLPGSGADGVLLRYRPEGGSWTEWQRAQTAAELPNVGPTDTLDVEVKQVDRVGNEGAVGSATLNGLSPRPNVDLGTRLSASIWARLRSTWT